MKLLLFCFVSSVLFAGCLETTQEVTINPDGSGTISNTSDMSGIMGLVKQMGGQDAEKLEGETIDTIISLSKQADSIEGITPQEKEMVKKGTLRVNMDMKEGKFITGMKFPFSSPSEIKKYTELTNKLMFETIKKEMGNTQVPGMENMPAPSSIDDYYTVSFSNGLLIKALDKEKFAKADSDEFLKGMKQSSAMGLPMTATYIINLPRPAKKTEGKNIKVSDDKKKITVVADIDDFFDDPSKLEYRIEY